MHRPSITVLSGFTDKQLALLRQQILAFRSMRKGNRFEFPGQPGRFMTTPSCLLETAPVAPAALPALVEGGALPPSADGNASADLLALRRHRLAALEPATGAPEQPRQEASTAPPLPAPPEADAAGSEGDDWQMLPTPPPPSPVVISDDEEPAPRPACAAPARVEPTECGICLDACANRGAHQLCSLRCGHVFGRACIELWLRKSANSRRCPHCKAACRVKDVRPLYASSVVAVDVDELEEQRARAERLQAELLTLRSERASASAAAAAERASHAQTQAALARAQSNLLSASGRAPHSPLQTAPLPAQAWRHYGIVTTASGADALAVLPDLVVTARLFPAPGVSASPSLCIASYPGPKLIRMAVPGVTAVYDIQLARHAEQTLALLACSSRLALVSLTQCMEVASAVTPQAVTCCAWGPEGSDEVYAGMADGYVLIYSLRNLAGGPLASLAPAHSAAPLHSILWLPDGMVTASRQGMSCYVNGRPAGRSPVAGRLRVDGDGAGCVALTWDQVTGTAIASMAPTAQVPHMRHVFLAPSRVAGPNRSWRVLSDGLSSGVAATLPIAGTAAQCPAHISGDLFAALDGEGTVAVWELHSRQLRQKVVHPGVTAVRVAGDLLATLSPTNLRIHRRDRDHV